MTTSLITVTFNSASTLSTFWGGYRGNSDTEWIVVDNASTDETAEVAAALGARVISLQENLGFGRANNIGFELARGNFLGFVNPDVTVDIDDLPLLSDLAAQHQAMIAPQLLNPDLSPQPNGRGYPLLSAKLRNRLRGDDDEYLLSPPPDSERTVCWVMGAAVFAHRSVFEALGPWDPGFFIYYEDADIGLRGWRNGAPTYITSRASWVHGWARETTEFRFQPWRREIASMTKFYSRYPELLLTKATAAMRHKRAAESVFGRRP